MLRSLIKVTCYSVIMFLTSSNIYTALAVGMLLVIAGVLDFKAGYEHALEEYLKYPSPPPSEL